MRKTKAIESALDKLVTLDKLATVRVRQETPKTRETRAKIEKARLDARAELREVIVLATVAQPVLT